MQTCIARCARGRGADGWVAPSRSGDIMTCIPAQELPWDRKLSVLVGNKPGAGGNLAMHKMLRASPDGHSVLLAEVGMPAVTIRLD